MARDDAGEIALHQGDAGAVHGDLGAGAHGDADIGCGEGRGVVDAVARHGDDAAFRASGGGSAACLSSGSTSASTSAMPRRRATASAVARLSPVSITIRMPWARGRRSASRRRRLDRVRDGDDAGGPAVDRQIAAQWRRPAAAIGLASRHRVRPRDRASGRRLPSATAWPSTSPVTPLPVIGRKSVRFRRAASSRSRAAATMAAASGCSLDRSDRCRERQQVVLGPVAGAVHDRDHARLALGQRAGLVDDQRIDLFQPLQRFGGADQDAGPRALADADHDRHRRRQAERAGAGNDQHRDGGDQGVGEGRGRTPDRPGGERQQRRRRSPPARTSRRRRRPGAGSARASVAPRRPWRRCGRAWSRVPTRSAA